MVILERAAFDWRRAEHRQIRCMPFSSRCERNGIRSPSAIFFISRSKRCRYRTFSIFDLWSGAMSIPPNPPLKVVTGQIRQEGYFGSTYPAWLRAGCILRIKFSIRQPEGTTPLVKLGEAVRPSFVGRECHFPCAGPLKADRPVWRGVVARPPRALAACARSL